MDRFSKRQGLTVVEKPITIREDAPTELREFIPQLAYDFEQPPSFIRGIICRILKVSPDRGNWSEFPNIAYEVETLIKNCDWNIVYEIIEEIYSRIDSRLRKTFSDELNEFFKLSGIGWKIEDGIIETRGDENFEKSLSEATKALETAELPTAHSEMNEALRDLSRRPHPDITGAIQHSLACIECVCREVSGDPKATLGDIMKRFSGIVPKPLDTVIEKIWGYSSEQGRHLKEGKTPEYIEAELIVGLTAALVTYLGKKISAENQAVKKSDLPF